MATTIRLTRLGKKKRPFYRLIVVDSRNRRDGAATEQLGYYNPFADPYECKIDAGGTIAWLKLGAGLSDTARSLLRNEGVLLRWHLEKQGVPTEEIDGQVEAFRSARRKKFEVVRVEKRRKADEKARAVAAAAAAARKKAQAEAAPPADEAPAAPDAGASA
jgi:small subunit ribosomal protein S16